MFIFIDNYDSFTFNLVQYFGEIGVDTDVYRNDALTADDVIALSPSGIVLSPGPSDPDHAGICLDLIKKAEIANIPLLGICLGHQALGQVYGAPVIRHAPVHGKVMSIQHNQQDLFKGIPSPYPITRYHSLIVDCPKGHEKLEITAWTDDGIVMGLKHKNKPLYGVQFHPESYATEHGHHLLKNFVDLALDHNV